MEENRKENVCTRCGHTNPPDSVNCLVCGYRIITMNGFNNYEIKDIVRHRNAPASDFIQAELQKHTEVALHIATRAHAGQLDKGGRPYIEHPLTLYRMITEGTAQEPLKTILANTPEEFRLQAGIVALLHDVLEDTDVTYAYLEKEMRIPHECVEAIRVITKDEKATYESYLDRVHRSKLAAVVKIADMLHNSDLGRLPAVRSADLARVAKYQKAIKRLSHFTCECCHEVLPLYYMSEKNTRQGQVFCDVCYGEYDILYDMAEDALWGR